MDEEILRWMVLGGITVSGLAVSVSAWFPRQKRLADWFMVAGGTMTPLSFIGMILYYEILALFASEYDWLEHLINGGLAGGAVLFAMGYVLDRAGRRKAQDYDRTSGPLPPMR
jgi:hypothetical protein